MAPARRVLGVFGEGQRHVAAQPALGWHRRGHRLAGPGQVVLADPEGEVDDLLGKERDVVQDLEDVAQARRRVVVEWRVVVGDQACEPARAERHDHARAPRCLNAVGQAIGQQAEPRDGHGHADQSHQRASPRRRARTCFMSSHVSRFSSGLRSRYAGWKVGISFAPRKSMHAAAQPRDRHVGPQQRLRGELAERDDHLRLDRVDLPEQERLARARLRPAPDCGSPAAGT